MKARIIRMGKSQGIRLSKSLLKKAKLGNDVVLRAELGRILICENVKPRIGWAEAARRMRERNEDRDPASTTETSGKLGLLTGQTDKVPTRTIGETR